MWKWIPYTCYIRNMSPLCKLGQQRGFNTLTACISIFMKWRSAGNKIHGPIKSGGERDGGLVLDASYWLWLKLENVGPHYTHALSCLYWLSCPAGWFFLPDLHHRANWHIFHRTEWKSRSITRNSRSTKTTWDRCCVQITASEPRHFYLHICCLLN